MNRKEFLRGAGLAGLGLTMPITKSLAKESFLMPPDVCVLIPSETAGPFPLDLSANTTFFRQDIRETQQGVQLNVKMKIIGLDNCLPMSNVRVNIWHCTKDGVYSGYNNNQNQGGLNTTYLRGYQFTDSHGMVEFVTIFPGWYTGRITHIHFQVYVSSSYSAISQFSFDIPTKNAIYAANSAIYTKGADPATFANDNIFSDGYAYQIVTLTPNSTTGGYDSYIEVAVQGNGTSGVGHIEKETAKVFELGQNFPNPYIDQTTIPFVLKQPSEITLELWDLSGRKVATLLQDSRSAGEYQLVVNPSSLGLSKGNYVYQLTAVNSNGRFSMPKLMTIYK
ncbi:MAG: T9SS type A sorting domain-containing protein [Saprospiraceae bacterium]|nr:T9SS type A sorting domain-containing protein [Saprospiraceae bacterium]